MANLTPHQLARQLEALIAAGELPDGLATTLQEALSLHIRRQTEQQTATARPRWNNPPAVFTPAPIPEQSCGGSTILEPAHHDRQTASERLRRQFPERSEQDDRDWWDGQIENMLDDHDHPYWYRTRTLTDLTVDETGWTYPWALWQAEDGTFRLCDTAVNLTEGSASLSMRIVRRADGVEVWWQSDTNIRRSPISGTAPVAPVLAVHVEAP